MHRRSNVQRFQRRDTNTFWCRPSGRDLRLFLALYAAVLLLFAIVYVGADTVTAHRTLRIPVHFGWELKMPFVAGAIWIYMSVYVAPVLTPFIVAGPRRLRAFAAALGTVIVVAGVCFLLLPSSLAYPPLPPLGSTVTARVFRFADAINLQYNLVPSLHVALVTTSAAVFAERAGWLGRACLCGWALAMGAATLLTHQHHVVDVVTAFALALLAERLVYRPLCRRLQDTARFLRKRKPRKNPSRRPTARPPPPK